MNRAARDFDPLAGAEDFRVTADDETEAAGQHRINLVDLVFVIGKNGAGLVDVLRNAIAERFELGAKTRFRERAFSGIPAMWRHACAPSVGDGGMPGTVPFD